MEHFGALHISSPNCSMFFNRRSIFFTDFFLSVKLFDCSAEKIRG